MPTPQEPDWKARALAAEAEVLRLQAELRRQLDPVQDWRNAFDAEEIGEGEGDRRKGQ